MPPRNRASKIMIPAPHIQSHATGGTAGIVHRADAGVGSTGSADKGDFGEADGTASPAEGGCAGAMADAGGTGAVRGGVEEVMGSGDVTDRCG